MNITCDSCESIFEVRFNDKDTEGTPEYCPFCGDLLEDPAMPPEEDFEVDHSRWEEI